MAAKVKVDQIETVDGTGSITLNNDIAMASSKTLPAASLTGTLPAISGANLTGVLPLAGGTMTGVLTVNSGSNLAFQANGTTYTQIWQTLQSPNDLTLKTTADKFISFQPNSTEKVRIHSSGVTSFNNGIELGSGLDATAANTLDDYEEGTFTPSVSAAASHSVQVGVYTKVGNLVTAMVKIECALSSGNLWVSGLPFAASNTSNYYTSGSFFGVVGIEDFGDGSIAPQIAPGGTVIQLYIQNNSSTANYETPTANHVGTTANFTINVAYIV